MSRPVASPATGAAPEMPRPIIPAKVTSKGVSETIAATDAERPRIARRLDLVSVEALTATVRLTRVRGEMIRVEGRLAADVVQTCVVTLDPVPAHIEEEFSALFAPDHLLPSAEEGAEIDLSYLIDDTQEDAPEPMPGGRVDIGELAIQHLSLALDPYPRAPGAAFAEIVEHDDEEEKPVRPNPFAALAPLKRRT